MKSRAKQPSFSAVRLIVVLAVVVALGFAGYTVYNSLSANNESATATDVVAAPKIKSNSDLDQASATLDQTDPDGSNTADANQLDNELSAF